MPLPDEPSASLVQRRRRAVVGLVLGCAVLLTLSLAALGIADRDGAQTAGLGGTWIDSADPLAMRVSPLPGSTVHQSPPDFHWPGIADVMEYEVSLTGPKGETTTLHTAANWINWNKTLVPGDYVWRVRPLKSDAAPSQPMRFTVAADAQSFVVPSSDALLTTVMQKPHPRGFPAGAAKVRLLAALQGERAVGFRALLAHVQTDMARPLAVEPVQMAALNGNQTIRPQALNLPELIEPEVRQAIEAGFAYQATGNRAFARESIRRALNLAGWDAHGATGFRTYDLVSRRIAWCLALVFDWLYDELTADERTRILRAIEIRQADIFDDLVGPKHRLENYPYDSHGWETLGFSAAITALVAGEIKPAEPWFKQLVPWYFNSASPWGGEDGGFANGTGYAVWVLDSLPVWDVLSYATGVDVTEKQWVKGFADYLMYFLPPNAPGGAFGDGAEEPVQTSLIKAFALRLRSRAFADYTGRLAGIFPAYFGLLFAPADRQSTQGEAFSALPGAALFPSIGWAAMLGNPSDDDRVAIYFKSSPYGSLSHSHADQNSFIVYAKGRKLLVDSGYYDWHGSPHWRQWYSQTAAKNAITFDGGQGQTAGRIEASGSIIGFRHAEGYDIVSGEASAAYGKALTRAVRSLVFLRPDTILVFDALQAPVPRHWEWNFHTVMPIDTSGEGVLRIGDRTASLCLRMLQPAAPVFSQTDRFPVAPNTALPQPQQWHGRYSTAEATSAEIFITLLSIDCKPVPAVRVEHQGTAWTVSLGERRIQFNETGSVEVR